MRYRFEITAWVCLDIHAPDETAARVALNDAIWSVSDGISLYDDTVGEGTRDVRLYLPDPDAFGVPYPAHRPPVVEGGPERFAELIEEDDGEDEDEDEDEETP